MRRVGVAWWEANVSEVMWQGMTVAKLCSTVSVLPLEEYKEHLRKGREGVDAALLRGLGRAHGVNVLTCQQHADEALLGEDMMENASDGTDLPKMVPIALVDNRHFWGQWDT